MHGIYLLSKLHTFQRPRWAGLMLGLSFCFPFQVFAAINTDGTVGLATNLTGPNYAISASLGSQVGSNLFHSFSVFDVNTGESATFSGPNGITNIIARVTGGAASTINGGLNSTIPQANLILVNPSGIVFGSNASLNVGGAFYATTANYVNLADGGVFDATTPANSVLTTAPLAAFGFVGPAAPISAQGANLVVSEGQTLSLIGGDINVTGSLMARGGTVNVASVASAGEVGLTSGLDTASFSSLGKLSLDAAVNVSEGLVTTQSGSIYIHGGEITVGPAAWLTSNTFSSAGGNIVVDAANSLTIQGGISASVYASGPGQGGSIGLLAGHLVLDNAKIYADTYGAGNAGSVVIIANLMDVLNGSWVSSDALAGSTGQGGNVIVSVADLLTVGGSMITTEARDSGSGGNINLHAGKMVLDNAKIYADAYGAGNAGSVMINATQLDVLNGSWVSSDTLAGSTGQGGNVIVNVDGLLVSGSTITSQAEASGAGGYVSIQAGQMVLDNAKIYADTYASGDAGLVMIKANQLDVLNGSWVSSDALAGSSGQGGNVFVNVAGHMAIANGSITTKASGSGRGGNVWINAATSVAMSGGARIKSDSTGTGDAGFIWIETPRLNIDGGTISSRTAGLGAGGLIAIYVDKLTLSNAGGTIDTSTSSISGSGGYILIRATTSAALSGGTARIKSDSTGDALAGYILIETPELNIDGGTISSMASGLGSGGYIAVNVDRLTLSNAGEINASSFNGGNGGNIGITATSSISLNSGAKIASKSAGNGTAGRIGIDSGGRFISENSSVTTEALVSDGGNISLVARDLIYMNRSDITATVGSGVGNGGNIFIDPQFVVLNNSNVTANAFGGNGGNINLIANNFFQSANSSVTASSQLGVSGTVALNTQLTDLSGSLANLPMVYLDASGLIRQRCAAQLDGKISTFVMSGRGGIPQEPGRLMPSTSLLAGQGAQPGIGVMQADLQYASLLEPSFGCLN